MAERVVGRLVTGRLAFLIGGLLDVLGFAVQSLRSRARAGARRRR